MQVTMHPQSNPTTMRYRWMDKSSVRWLILSQPAANGCSFPALFVSETLYWKLIKLKLPTTPDMIIFGTEARKERTERDMVSDVFRK